MNFFYLIVLDIDDCADEPCENGGTCVDQVDSFVCKCALGFEGDECEIGKSDETRKRRRILIFIFILDIDDCADEPCQNGGACVDQVNDFMCNCADGYEGETCEIGTCVS